MIKKKEGIRGLFIGQPYTPNLHQLEDFNIAVSCKHLYLYMVLAIYTSAKFTITSESY